MKPKLAIHVVKRLEIRDGKIVTVVDERAVRIMAEAEGYAMVRRKGAMPYVASVKELFPVVVARAGGSGE